MLRKCAVSPVMGAWAAFVVLFGGVAQAADFAVADVPGESPFQTRYYGNVTTSVIFADNIALTTDADTVDSEVESFGLETSLTLGALLHASANRIIAAEANGRLRSWAEEDANDFDVVALRPTLRFGQRWQLGGRRALTRGSLGYLRDYLGGDGFSHRLRGSAFTTIALGGGFSFRNFVTLQYTDFDDKGTIPARDNRDAPYGEAGIGLGFTPISSTTVYGDVSALRNAGDGTNQRYDGYRIGGGLIHRTQIMALDAGAALRGNLAHRDYFDFATTPARDQDRLFVSASFFVYPTRLTKITATISHLESDANLAAFEYANTFAELEFKVGF